MARVILISYAGYPYTPSSLMPDNGLANLAGALIETGHQVLILDYGTVDTIKRLYPERLSEKALPIYRKLLTGQRRPTIRDFISLKLLGRAIDKNQERSVLEIGAEVIGKIEDFHPDFIGFKLWNGDGFTGSIKIAEIIKKSFPLLKIFAGGPQVDIFKAHIYSATDVFEALVYAEGEEVLPQLCRYCAGDIDLSEIPNLIYRRDSRTHVNGIKWIDNLDNLPFPIYAADVYPAMRGDQKIKIITLDESRGCPYHCAFCIQPIKSGAKLRLKSPRRVIEEMKMVQQKYRVNSFRYAGSSTPLRHAVNIADGIIREELKITYSTFGHVQKASDADFEILKKSGCHSIFFGIESGSREVLRRGFGKDLDPDLIRQTLLSCRKAGIFTVGSMIFPGPFETEQTEQESIDLLLASRPDAVPIQFPGIYPGTPWHLNPEKYNFKITTPDYEKDTMNYKIKLLFPPRFWDALPYRLNDKSFKEFAAQTSDFSKKLEAASILTHISDDQALMALHGGYQGRERAFRDLLRLSFLVGDSASIMELVSSINSSIEAKGGN